MLLDTTSNLQGWQQDALAKHNELRAKHADTPAMTWSTAMEKSAQDWADRGQFEHSNCYKIAPPAGPAGENLAMGHGTIVAAIQDWYNEIDNCQSLPGCEKSKGGMIGHFTAMVWAGATELGCGYNAGKRLYVCRYRGGNSLSCKTPNMGGCYTANVKQLGGGGGGGGAVPPPKPTPRPSPRPSPSPSPSPRPTPSEPGATFSVGDKNKMTCKEGSPVSSKEQCQEAAEHFDVKFKLQTRSKTKVPTGCSQANNGQLFWNDGNGRANRNRKLVCTGGDDMPPLPGPRPTPRPTPKPPAPRPRPGGSGPRPRPAGSDGCAKPDTVGETSVVLNGKRAHCSQLSRFCSHSFVSAPCPCTCSGAATPPPAPAPSPTGGGGGGGGGECCACSSSSDCGDGAFCCPYMKKCSFSGTSCYTGSDCNVAKPGKP